MTMKKRNDRILDAVHETARDLHRLGFIDARMMRQYDALRLAPSATARPRQTLPVRVFWRDLADRIAHLRAPAGKRGFGRCNRSAVSGVGFRLTSGQR
ncbi:MAG: hypothetical protein Fur0019_17990 [Tibeticola sp.]